MGNRIGIAVCAAASFMMLCCKNDSDARAVNEPVNEPERPLSFEDSLRRDGVKISDYERFVQEEKYRNLFGKKGLNNYKSRHRDSLWGGLSKDDHHVPDSGYMYDTALGRMMTEYFEKHYGKITASGTDAEDDKISYFPRIFNPYDNEWVSDLVTDSLDYDVRCDTIISWNKNNGYGVYGVLFSRKDAISYRKSLRIVKPDGKWRSPRCFNVWDGEEEAAPEHIPAIYYWDTIAINNTEEVDYSDVLLPAIIEGQCSHFLRTIIRNGEITSMEFFYNSGGPEKFYKKKEE